MIQNMLIVLPTTLRLVHTHYCYIIVLVPHASVRMRKVGFYHIIFRRQGTRVFLFSSESTLTALLLTCAVQLQCSRLSALGVAHYSAFFSFVCGSDIASVQNRLVIRFRTVTLDTRESRGPLLSESFVCASKSCLLSLALSNSSSDEKI